MHNSYSAFLDTKSQLGGAHGFKPLWMPEFLFDFQVALTDWAIRKGRGAIFADCGLGKTPMQLVWAENIVRKTNRPVLILTPLAVGHQTIREGEKFGIKCARSADGKIPTGAQIIVTNYERLHYFNASDFVGCVCDESSILKNYSGATRNMITDFMATMPYRLLCTATAAPNDYVELGNSSEAVGSLKRKEMLSMFFIHDGGDTQRWRLKRHATHRFWQWVCSWARAVRSPADMGFDENGFALPELITREHVIKASRPRDGFLFDLPAIGLQDEREERNRTLPERCGMAAQIVNSTTDAAICWCYLNAEGNMLEKLIPDAVNIEGSDTDEHKEEVFAAFQSGNVRVLVTKPRIAGFGLNFQHCAHQTFFPSHSYEQWYQAIRRSWRFGQTKPVMVDMIASDGSRGILANLQRKDLAATQMFQQLVNMMGNELHITKKARKNEQERIPSWL